MYVRLRKNNNKLYYKSNFFRTQLKNVFYVRISEKCLFNVFMSFMSFTSLVGCLFKKVLKKNMKEDKEVKNDSKLCACGQA